MQVNLDKSPKLDDEEAKDVPEIFNRQKQFFLSGKTWDYNFRKSALETLLQMVKENEEELISALHKDMKRPRYEAYGSEIGQLYQEIKLVKKNLKQWMRPRKVKSGLAHFGASTKIESVPKGVVLIVGAWNYPVLLTLLPLVSSIAAGNTAIIKPSEYSRHTTTLLDELLAQYFDSKYLDIIPGGVETAQELLRQNFDQIFFTGSERVGKIYAKKAAETLTPCILELGGKSPTIIHNDANLDVTVERIAFGKFFNASQTCVAPDYILVHEDIEDELIEKFKSKIIEFFGEDPQQSDDYGRIINIGHFERICELKRNTTGKILIGGNTDEDELYIEPTIIQHPDLHDRIMNEEIFGPLLPILSYKSMEDIKKITDQNPNPLALYIFSESKEFIQSIRKLIPAGDIGINEVAFHFAVPGLKIGGLKNSGIGGYRGKIGFDALSHQQSVYQKTTWIQLPFIKPPYTKFKEFLLRLFQR